MSREKIRMNLLPFKKQGASITRNGIIFQKLHYTCDTAEQDNWYVKARDRGSERVDVVYDPRNTDSIYLVMNERQSIVPCRLLDKSKTYSSCSWYDVLDYFDLLTAEKGAARTSDEQAIAGYHAQVDTIVEQAKQRTAESKPDQKSHRAVVKGIKDNRDTERALDGASTSWLPQDNVATVPSDLAAAASSSSPGKNVENEYVPRASRLKSIKEAHGPKVSNRSKNEPRISYGKASI